MDLNEETVGKLEDIMGLSRDGSWAQVDKIQNGIFTIKNPNSGQHRTYKVKTQKKEARFAPGERIISVLTGSNNADPACYTGVGFVKKDGIAVWKKQQDTELGAVVKFFWKRVALNEHLDFELYHEGRCSVCNRPLTVPESIVTGIGPICADRAASDAGIDPLVVKYWRLKARVEGTV